MTSSAPSTPSPSTTFTVRTTLIALLAVLAAGLIATLTWFTENQLAPAVTAGVSAFVGTFTFFDQYLAR